jgi:hypothetical protein
MKKSTKFVLIPVLAGALIAPASASADAGYTDCSPGQSTSTWTRGDYRLVIDRYRGHRMNCSSVRYVVNRWLRPKAARQYGWPTIARPFYDGWVTWHCWKISHNGVQCDEFTSNTSFRVRGRVYA